MLFRPLSLTLGKMFSRFPLKTVLIVPFILQIVTAVGLVDIFLLSMDANQLRLWRVS